MEELKKETVFARENIESDDYKKRVASLESDLHELRDKLADVEIKILQDKGYKPINIDDITIMAPVGMSFQQLHNAIQQMSPPEDGRKRAIKNLVKEEDRRSVHDHEDYQEVVEDRQDIIDDVMDVYEEFWKNEVEPIAETDDEKIVYMMVGLDKNIRARKLSSITGVSKYACRKYSFSEGEVVKKR